MIGSMPESQESSPLCVSFLFDRSIYLRRNPLLQVGLEHRSRLGLALDRYARQQRTATYLIQYSRLHNKHCFVLNSISAKEVVRLQSAHTLLLSELICALITHFKAKHFSCHYDQYQMSHNSVLHPDLLRHIVVAESESPISCGRCTLPILRPAVVDWPTVIRDVTPTKCRHFAQTLPTLANARTPWPQIQRTCPKSMHDRCASIATSPTVLNRTHASNQCLFVHVIWPSLDSRGSTHYMPAALFPNGVSAWVRQVSPPEVTHWPLILVNRTPIAVLRLKHCREIVREMKAHGTLQMIISAVPPQRQETTNNLLLATAPTIQGTIHGDPEAHRRYRSHPAEKMITI